MKKEFKLNTKVGQRVTRIEINIRSDADKHKNTSTNKEGVHIKDFKIVYQNYMKTAVDTSYINTFYRQEKGSKKISDCFEYLEDLRVSIVTRETYFPNGIFGTVYTIGNPKIVQKKLIKEMQKQVDDKFGFLANINIESKVNEFTR